MNATVARLTVHGLLGRRRGVLLFLLPALMVALAALIRLLVADLDTGTTAALLAQLGMGVIVPLLGLIAGTGAIGPEIDDGSIVHLLSKPVPRSHVVVSKLAVAAGTAALLSGGAMLLAGLIMSGTQQSLAAGYAVAAVVASLAYGALFLMLAVITRHAVVLGLLYAVIWEGLIGSFAAGARALSVQQWAISIGGQVAGGDALDAQVSLGVAVAMLIVATVAATTWAAHRLRSLALTGED
jgi:ABC-2 type transport system permease protein